MMPLWLARRIQAVQHWVARRSVREGRDKLQQADKPYVLSDKDWFAPDGKPHGADYERWRAERKRARPR